MNRIEGFATKLGLRVDIIQLHAIVSGVSLKHFSLKQVLGAYTKEGNRVTYVSTLLVQHFVGFIPYFK